MRRLLIALVTTLAFVFCAAPAMAKKQMSEHSAAATKSAKPKKAKPAPKAKAAAPATKKAVPAVPTKSKNGKKIARRERAGNAKK